MFNPIIAAAAALAAYLIGSLSIARLFARLFAPERNLEKVDIGVEGLPIHRIKTVGATTASIVLGARLGYTIAFLDILKGLLPVLAFCLLFPEGYYHLIAAVFATVGHNWPLYHRFKGGGGLSTTLGGFFVVDWLGTLASMATGIVLGAVVLREIAVAFLSIPWLMLIWLAVFKGDWPHILYGLVMNLVMTLAVIPDISEHIRVQRRYGKVDVAENADLIPMYSFLSDLLRRLRRRPRAASASEGKGGNPPAR